MMNKVILVIGLIFFLHNIDSYSQTLQVTLSPDKSKVDRSTKNGTATIFFDSSIDDLSIICTDENPDESITKITDNLWFTHIDVKKDIETDGLCYRNYLIKCSASAEYYLTTDTIAPNQVLYYTITLPNELEPKLQEEKVKNIAVQVSNLVDEGDSYTARVLALEALPPKLPYSLEAEMAFRKAMAEASVALRGHNGRIVSMCFSPDSKSVLSCSEDSTARIWEVKTGRLLRTLSGHKDRITSCAFSPDGKMIATSSKEELRIWDTQTGRSLKTFSLPSFSSSFSPDGKHIVTSGADMTIRICDSSTGSVNKIIPFKEGFPWIVKYSPDGHQIICSIFADKNFIVGFDSQTGEELYRLEGHKEMIMSFACSSDSKKIVSASTDSTIRVWDTTNGNSIFVLKCKHPQIMLSAAFAFDEKAIVGVSWDKNVTIWSTNTGKEVLTTQDEIMPRGPKDMTVGVAISSDLNSLVSYSTDNVGWLRELFPGPDSHLYKIGKHIYDVTYSPDGTKIAVALGNDGISILNAKNGECLYILDKEENDYRSVSFSTDGRYLVSSSFFKKMIRIWDTDTRHVIASWNENPDWVYSARFSPDGRHVISGCGSDVYVWDIATSKVLNIMKGHGNTVKKVCYSPDGQIIASASIDNTVRLWDSKSYNCLKVLKGHSNNVEDIAFSPDGRYLASASQDGTIKVWDVNRGNIIHSLKGHFTYVENVAFSPDGQILLSCGDDKKIIVWDVQNGKQYYSWNGYSDPYSSLSFSPDGSSILAFKNKAVFVWDFPPLQQLINETRERFKDRPLTQEEKAKYNLEL